MKRLEADNRTLAEYNIVNGSTIFVEFGLKRLFIKFDSGAAKMIWIRPYETVENVKKAIYQQHHGMIPNDKDVMVFEVSELQGGQTLESYLIYGDMFLSCTSI